MPQLTQLPQVFWSQLFWLAIVFAIIFFVIGRGMVPKIQSTVDLRTRKIADDLAAADAARDAADVTEAAYRERMDAGRAEAAKLTGQAKEDSARATEARLKKADSAIVAKIEKAEAQIRDARASAVKDIESLAADLAQDVAGRVAGIQVSPAESKQAVKAVMSDA